MSGSVFEKGREGFADGSINWAADTMRCLLLSPTADSSLKIITAVTNANPAVFTATSHGLSVNDVVVVGGVLGNLAGNQLAKVAGVVDANNFTLKTYASSLAVQGSGAYVSGGWVLSLMAQTRDLIDAGQVGTPTALTTKTKTNGFLDADDVSFNSITGTIIGAFVYKDNGSAAADRLTVFHDGRIQVTCAAQASSGATLIAVAPLDGALPTGAVLAFSNGIIATLTAPAAAGDLTIAVGATAGAIPPGHTAEGQVTNNNLPFTFSGGGGVTTNIVWGPFIGRV